MREVFALMATALSGRENQSGGMSYDPIIKWAYRHGNLEADTYPTLDEAVSSAYFGGEYGHEALDCIEVVNDDGTRTVHGADAVWQMAEPIERAESEAFARTATPVARLRLQGPDGRWGTEGSYSDQGTADEAANEWSALPGNRSVRMNPCGIVTAADRDTSRPTWSTSTPRKRSACSTSSRRCCRWRTDQRDERAR